MSDDSPFSRGARIDRAIDRAVHEMVHRDPPADLRRRVLARLERQTHLSWAPRLVVASVALAVVAVLAIYLRPEQPPQAPRAESAVASVARAPQVVAPALPEAAQRGQAPGERPRRTRATDTLIRMPPVGNVFESRADRAAGASVEAWPLEASPAGGSAIAEARTAELAATVAPPALRTGAIVIAPLEINELQIAPLRK